MFLLLACTPSPDNDRPWDAIDDAAAESAGDTGGSAETPDTGETNNGPRDGALLLDTPQRVGDGDLLRFTASDDLGRGALALQFTEVQGGSVWYSLYVGGEELFLETADLEGADFEGWFTVAPGVEYVLEVEGFGGGKFSAELLTTFTSVPDRYEPNDVADEAVSMENSTLDAYFHSPAEAAYDRWDSGDDWYTFSTTASHFSVNLTGVHRDFATAVYVYEPGNSGNAVAWGNGAEGEDVSVNVAGAGDWVVCVRNYGGTSAAAGVGPLPSHLTSPYTLTVTR